MNEEQKETVNRCARILRATGTGQVIIDACGPKLRYLVESCGRTRHFGSLEDLEAFAEKRLYNRQSYTQSTRFQRKRYASHFNYASL